MDVRIIAASNRDLKKSINQGNFREDLFYRLNVISFEMPPLRNRKEDIPLLVTHFLEKYCNGMDRQLKRIAPEVIDVQESHSWPGNVRELENLVERSVIMTRSDMITQDDFPSIITEKEKPEEVRNIGVASGSTLKDAEKEIIIRTLEETGGNRTHTAKILGISRRTLQLKLKEYGIN